MRIGGRRISPSGKGCLMLRRLTRLSLAFIVFASLTGLIVAHGNSDLRSATQYGYRNGYADGFQRGREDRQARERYDFHGPAYDNAMRGYESYMGSREEYREGYRKGYVAGYNDGFHDYEARFAGPNGSGPYDQGNDGPVPAYEPRPGHGQRNLAFQIGYRDGLIVGRKDRSKNKKFRPTKNDKYEDADHGFDHHYGSKKEYKREYREGFVAGYERGYGSLHSHGRDG